MTFRLLSKREVDQKKAQDRKRELEQGEKLARTVDTLRELRQEEEAKFEKWRTVTLADIQSEISFKETELNVLLQETVRAEKRREAALASLDGEWDKVHAKEAQLDDERVEFIKDEKSLQQAIALNIQRERDNENEKGRILEERHRTSTELIQAHREKEEASALYRKATERSETLNAALALRERELVEKEEKARGVIFKAEQRVHDIEKYEADLAKREVALRDGWKRLEDTQKQLHDRR